MTEYLQQHQGFKFRRSFLLAHSGTSCHTMLNMSFSAGSSSSCAMLATAAIWGISAVVAYAVFARFRDWRRLKHIDGPSLAGWTDYWMIRSQLSGRMNLDLADVVREYGVYQYLVSIHAPVSHCTIDSHILGSVSQILETIPRARCLKNVISTLQ